MTHTLSRLAAAFLFGLLTLAWPAATAHAQDPAPLTVYPSIYSGPTPTGPSPVNQPVSWTLTANYQNQPTSGPSYCPVSDPKWGGWTFSAQYNSSDPNNLSTVSPGPNTYGISVNDDAPSDPTVLFQFTPYEAGYWSITATTSVSFNDGACQDVWTATASLVLFLVAAPPAPPPFQTFSSPNNAQAINNQFIEQVLGNTEVLKGWNIKYQANDPTIDNTKPITWKWFSPASGNTGVEGNGNPATVLQSTNGTFQIWYEATNKAGGAIVSARRTVVISELTPAGFAVTVPGGGGLYQRNRIVTDYVAAPAPPPAVNFAGTVNYAAGGPPALTKFKAGMVQSVVGTRTAGNKYAGPPVWAAASPVGTTVTIPQTYAVKSIPAPPKNDILAPGTIFYPLTDVALAAAFASNDTPSSIWYGDVTVTDSAGNAAIVTYNMDGNQKFDLTFVDWITAYNEETTQVAPLQQAGWTLAWDTSVAIGVAPNYTAAPVAAGGVVTALVNPAQSVIPFNPLTVGPNVAPAPKK